ncbi:MAG: hypothetical protein LBR60_02805 [Fibrobacter sp.]|jgi:hypothetical protein|nr:hypothetical protein [Fibrobacter sp.]
MNDEYFPSSHLLPHPSNRLLQLYAKKCYQGQDPAKAKIIFVGKDARWDFDLEMHPIWPLVEEYLKDGIAFGKKYRFHHPLLHFFYKRDTDMKMYHQSFSKIGLSNNYIADVSFVELLWFPTTGSSKENNEAYRKYLYSAENRPYLKNLERWLNNPAKKLFISRTVLDCLKKLYKETGMFERFGTLEVPPKTIGEGVMPCPENIFLHTHLSYASPRVWLEIAQYI